MYSILEGLQPLGLLLDIIGFALVFRFGHAVFIRVSLGEIDREAVRGNYLTVVPEPGYWASVTRNRKQRLWAYAGCYMVGIGFVMQLIDSLSRYIR